MITETIIMKDLSIGYQTRKQCRVVAEGMNASLFAGELTCLIGANGVGKSTLLRTLAGFQKPLGGELMIRDAKGVTSLNTLHPKELAKIIAVVLTGKPDVTAMRVSEIVGIGRSPYTGFWGNLSAEDNEAVKEALHLVGVSPLANRMFHTLSDGERQKVMIAKALVQQTPIILLDEPTAFLDYPSKVEMLQLLRRLAPDLNKTIFLSTHDLELALQLADKLWLMEPQLSVGSPRELADKGSLSRFIDRSGISLDVSSLHIVVKSAEETTNYPRSSEQMEKSDHELNV